MGDDDFTLIDVGCSGGIDAIWRQFGARLRALGFDPNIHEIERLQRLESNDRIRYIPAFVGINPDHPFAKQKAAGPHTEHTFHNTDRFMRKAGFDLFNITVRRYSAAALPSRYQLSYPAQSILGRPLQGDALYLRDLCAPENASFASLLTPSKILKAAALMAMSNLPDHAAEILVTFRDKLQTICDVKSLLDILVSQVYPGVNMTYGQYIAAFEKNDPMFYPR